VEVQDTTRATAEMYGTGFLPTSFYLFSAVPKDQNTPGDVQVSEIWQKIHERDDKYFARTLSSFFSPKTQNDVLSGYLDLFDRTDDDGGFLVNTDDRQLLWDWVVALVKCAIKHEHEVRKPVIVESAGKEDYTHERFPDDSQRLIKYADMWDVEIEW